MVYTLTLNPALDYDLYVDSINTKKINEAKKVNFRAGGKGINVSIMLNNLEEQTVAMAYVGGFTGEFIKKSLNDMNISNYFIELDGNTRLNLKINTNDEEIELSGISSEIKEKDLLKLYEKLDSLKETDILVLSGSIPKGLKEDVYKTISSKTKAKIALDTRGELLLVNIHNNFVIKPNIKELEDVFSKKINSFSDMYELCKLFFDKNVENILVSMGGEGAVLVKKGKILKANVPKGKLINTIGAGDSTLAGFIYSKQKGLSDEESLKMSVACGSATAYSYNIGSKEEVFKLLEDIKVEELFYED